MDEKELRMQLALGTYNWGEVTKDDIGSYTPAMHKLLRAYISTSDSEKNSTVELLGRMRVGLYLCNLRIASMGHAVDNINSKWQKKKKKKS